MRSTKWWGLAGGIFIAVSVLFLVRCAKADVVERDGGSLYSGLALQGPNVYTNRFASPGPMPRGRWCGWKARQLASSDPGPAFNKASKWAHFGRASGPVAGAFAYNNRHVCKVVSIDGATIQCHGGNQCGRRGARTECVSTFPTSRYRYRVG